MSNISFRDDHDNLLSWSIWVEVEVVVCNRVEFLPCLLVNSHWAVMFTRATSVDFKLTETFKPPVTDMKKWLTTFNLGTKTEVFPTQSTSLDKKIILPISW